MCEFFWGVCGPFALVFWHRDRACLGAEQTSITVTRAIVDRNASFTVHAGGLGGTSRRGNDGFGVCVVVYYCST